MSVIGGMSEIGSTTLPVKLEKLRSCVDQSDILKDLLLFGNEKERLNCPFVSYALCKTREQFRLPSRVKMLHLNDVFTSDSDIWDKSPGLPWRELGYLTKGDIRKDVDAIQSVRRFWHFIKNGKNIQGPDCMAMSRAHLCVPNERKVRLIWCYPATITFGEAVFAKPLIDGYQALAEHSRPIAYGYETATGGMRKIIKRFGGYKQFAAIDFKNFDKTAPAWLIDIAFDILLDNIDLINYRDHGVADAHRMLIMYSYIKRYFIDTIIRLPNGDRYIKNSGIASGSHFTQLVGSVVNAFLINYASLAIDGAFPHDSIFMGDDSLIASKSTWSIDTLSEIFQKFGMEINMKSQCQKDLHSIIFLGYEINK